MVGLISIILSLSARNRTILIRRMPSTKALRAHLVGLTIGFLLAGLHVLLPFPPPSFLTSAILLLWFAFTTYFGGVWFFVNLVIFVFMLLGAPTAGTFASFFLNVSHWYFLGYLSGVIFAILYNDLVFLFMRFVEEDKIKIVFAYKPTATMNIIKSPIGKEEVLYNHIKDESDPRKREKLERNRLFRYKLPPDLERPFISERPYTIAFVANPKIHKNGLDEIIDSGYEHDPIMQDLDLFLRGVDNALFSLASDPVVGRPEIWSRVRVVTVFDPHLIPQAGAAPKPGQDYGLVEEFQLELRDQNNVPIVNNLIDPMKRMFSSVTRMLDEAHMRGERKFALSDFDVIFAMTASRTHTRSKAHFSDWIEHDQPEELKNEAGRTGRLFTLELDPYKNKEVDQQGNPLPPPPSAEPNTMFPALIDASDTTTQGYRKIHDFHAFHPGRVALNVLGARSKTYIHEFAHAFSSAFHGSIADEYVDGFILIKNGSTIKFEQRPPHFFINRLERNAVRMNTAAPPPVSKVFSEYNCTHFYSDLAHPSAEENWLGYFPEKFDKNVHCLMDRDTTGRYRFDELLSTFIYDRLMAKVTRP